MCVCVCVYIYIYNTGATKTYRVQPTLEDG